MIYLMRKIRRDCPGPMAVYKTLTLDETREADRHTLSQHLDSGWQAVGHTMDRDVAKQWLQQAVTGREVA